MYNQQFNNWSPHSEDEGVNLDDFSLAGKSEVGLILVLVQISQMGHCMGGSETHPERSQNYRLRNLRLYI